MRREEAGYLLALAPSLLQVGSLTWAGARASSKGTQLLRDGAVNAAPQTVFYANESKPTTLSELKDWQNQQTPEDEDW